MRLPSAAKFGTRGFRLHDIHASWTDTCGVAVRRMLALSSSFAADTLKAAAASENLRLGPHVFRSEI